ncbi:MAG: hypothetical protein DLM53_11180 [Candidatus Eremiobacter antarcticus]|nr:peptidylprolyl isomerase [Candidatus Eremiobacteraeota bacterium]MBC5807777.1 peptidylprolyl isomerase [Candidatus Eremiobacteraeota bacterium]PZR60604.1 MAG: hypothetical protein DLM53_11180 [Candidatus Eremiobacter sp. RRmetagenome_bin22]
MRTLAAVTSAVLLCCFSLLFVTVARGHLVSIAAAAPLGTLSPPPAVSSGNPAFTALGKLERDRKADPQKIATYLSDADPAVEARAAIALGRLGNPAAVPRLTAILADARKPDKVRSAAAFSLGVIGSPDSVGPLSSTAKANGSSVAAAAASALGRIGGATAVDVLTRLLSQRSADVRAQAAVGLGEAALPGSASIDNQHREAAAGGLASAILTERDPEVRWRMAWALGRAFYQSQPRTLRRLLTDDQELVRLFAVRGLGKLKDRSYALPIRLAVNDKSWRVRVEVRNALAALGDRTAVDVRPPPVPKADFEEPAPVATSSPHGDHPQVAFVTNKGVIVIEFFPDAAPYSVDNFLYLVDRGFYSGLQYFRVIADFVVQGGDPKNTGDGGPGYSIPAELNPSQQLTGILSYGLDYDQRRNVPLIDSAGSQYYITQSPQLHLDRGFTVFGRVVKGLSVVYAISPHNAGDAAAADVAKRVYRCHPVSVQSADVEEKLRTAEIGYQPQ